MLISTVPMPVLATRDLVREHCYDVSNDTVSLDVVWIDIHADARTGRNFDLSILQSQGGRFALNGQIRIAFEFDMGSSIGHDGYQMQHVNKTKSS